MYINHKPKIDNIMMKKFCKFRLISLFSPPRMENGGMTYCMII